MPSLKPAKEPQQFLMEETPCIVEIEAVLEQAGRRPVSQLEKQRIFFVSTILELVLLPTVLLLVLVFPIYFLGWKRASLVERRILQFITLFSMSLISAAIVL